MDVAMYRAPHTLSVRWIARQRTSDFMDSRNLSKKGVQIVAACLSSAVVIVAVSVLFDGRLRLALASAGSLLATVGVYCVCWQWQRSTFISMPIFLGVGASQLASV